MTATWVRVARRRRALFLAVMLVLATTLGWLGWRLLQQEEQLAGQRMTEQREVAADLIVAALDRQLTAVEQRLDRASFEGGASGAAGPTVIQIDLRSFALRVLPPARILYYPDRTESVAAADSIFAAADDFEFRLARYDQAAAAAEPFTRSHDRAVAAAAVVRVARNHAKRARLRDAAADYDRLEALGDVSVAGVPAAYAARLGRIAIHDRQGDRDAARREAQALQDDLHRGAFPISFPSFEFLEHEAIGRAEHAAVWTQSSPRVIAEAVAWLWDGSTHHTLPAASGRQTVHTSSGLSTVVWRSSADSLRGLIADGPTISATWLDELKPILDARRVQMSLTAANGQSARRSGWPPTPACRGRSVSPAPERPAPRSPSAGRFSSPA